MIVAEKFREDPSHPADQRWLFGHRELVELLVEPSHGSPESPGERVSDVVSTQIADFLGCFGLDGVPGAVGVEP